jgi:pimeloyl-ACP methyl ester carboxylesterase
LAATLPQARFALVPQAGHIPAIEQPATLATEITKFLAEVIHD